MAGKKMFTIKQVGSPIRRPKSQAAILTGLGLGKMHRVVEIEDTPSTRGMVHAVRHMVQVVED
ncbi:MAG: 50S ribosomal protein L30 [Sphingopyxis sp.]